MGKNCLEEICLLEKGKIRDISIYCLDSISLSWDFLTWFNSVTDWSYLSAPTSIYKGDIPRVVSKVKYSQKSLIRSPSSIWKTTVDPLKDYQKKMSSKSRLTKQCWLSIIFFLISGLKYHLRIRMNQSIA